MNSPKLRAGTGGAIGGLTLSLQRFGIPDACVTDGPSGLRLITATGRPAYRTAR